MARATEQGGQGRSLPSVPPEKKQAQNNKAFGNVVRGVFLATTIAGGLIGGFEWLTHQGTSEQTGQTTPDTKSTLTPPEGTPTSVKNGEAIDLSHQQFVLGKQAWLNPTADNHIDVPKVTVSLDGHTQYPPGYVAADNAGEFPRVVVIITGAEVIQTANGPEVVLGIGTINQKTGQRQWNEIILPDQADQADASSDLADSGGQYQEVGSAEDYVKKNLKIGEIATIDLETQDINSPLPGINQLYNPHVPADQAFVNALETGTTPPNNDIEGLPPDGDTSLPIVADIVTRSADLSANIAQPGETYGNYSTRVVRLPDTHNPEAFTTFRMTGGSNPQIEVYAGNQPQEIINKPGILVATFGYKGNGKERRGINIHTKPNPNQYR
jgi:hypothetical protein